MVAAMHVVGRTDDPRPVDVEWEQIQGARPRQEDLAFVQWHHGALVMALSDGMSGHLHGDVASRITLDTLRTQLLRSEPKNPDQWNTALHMAVERAHEAVNAFGARFRGEGLPPGAALVALILIPALRVWTYASVGHGLLYRCTSKGKFELMNKRHQRQDGRLTSCIGASADGLQDVDGKGQIRLMGPRDAFLLASNGIEVLDPLEIETLMDVGGPVKWIAKALLSRVERKANPRQGNTTVVTARMQPAS